MIQIRPGVFETNSSSSHAIVVKKTAASTFDPNDYHARDGEIIFYPHDLEFGWGFDILSTWYERLCYAIASLQDEQDMIETMQDACRKKFKKDIRFSFERNYHGGTDYGYIDHQSQGLLQHFLADRNISIEDFIFNDRYIVVIDNDNSASFFVTQETGLINESEIEKIYD